MVEVRDPFVGLERQRLQLEESISALQKSLYHWRLWDAEYDSLKEEIAALGENCTKEDFLKTGREFGGSLITENEIRVLLGESQGVSRSPQQVIDRISRRMEYVQRNIRVIEKNISAAEDKLYKVLVVKQPGVLDEEGLPLTDIVEELDDDGHVISRSTTTPGQAAPQLLEVLKKAGVHDLPEGGHDDDIRDVSSRIALSSSNSQADTAPDASPAGPTRNGNPGSIAKSAGSASNISTMGSRPRGHSTVPEREDGDTPIEADIDESPEDAALRREMLQYGLEEVGAVVAELELDEGGSEFSIEDDGDYLMTDEDDDEDEDEYGRTTRKVIDDDYHGQMLELEKKLNAKGLQNVGPDPSALPLELRQELEDSGARRHGVHDKINQEPAKKKKVTFANDLDIAPHPSNLSRPGKERLVESPQVAAVQESIVERAEATKADYSPEPKPKKKTSVFKTSRNAGIPRPFEAFPATSPAAAPKTRSPSCLPLFPAKSLTPRPFSQPIAESNSANPAAAAIPLQRRTPVGGLVEREILHDNPTPPDPYELDEALHRQEVTAEFYKLRNRRIQQNGGFLGDDEEPNQIVHQDEPESGEPRRKVSRFMAARIK